MRYRGVKSQMYTQFTLIYIKTFRLFLGVVVVIHILISLIVYLCFQLALIIMYKNLCHQCYFIIIMEGTP